MIIIPSIDIQNGKCVRLIQGDFKQTSVYHNTPEHIAQTFAAKGATTLHIVDLDGAQHGCLTQTHCIQKIRQHFPGILQVGGGIRSDQDIEQLFTLGIERIVLGSQAIQNIAQTKAWLSQYGPEKIVLALDFNIKSSVQPSRAIQRQGAQSTGTGVDMIVNENSEHRTTQYLDHTAACIPYLAVQGWQEQTQHTLWEVLDQYPNVIHVLCTDIGKDGMQTGPNFQFYEQFRQRYPHIQLQSSGGISNMQDILQLEQLGVSAAIIGKALYENKLSLEEILLCLK